MARIMAIGHGYVQLPCVRRCYWRLLLFSSNYRGAFSRGRSAEGGAPRFLFFGGGGTPVPPSFTYAHARSVPFARNVSSASASTDADSVGLRRADIFLRRENTFRSYRRRYSARAYLARILGTLRETHVSDSKGKRDKEAEKAV